MTGNSIAIIMDLMSSTVILLLELMLFVTITATT